VQISSRALPQLEIAIDKIRTYAVGVLSLRQSGTFSSYRSSFSRSTSAKKKNKMGKYHAAAGKYHLEVDHRVTRVH
jgi:hypothetical protein